MRIAVCDDNRVLLREIEELLLSLSMTDDIFLFSDLEAFLCSVKSGKKYNVVFMDICFENASDTGMDAAEELYRLSPATKVIYVTGNIEYSQHIFLRRSNLIGFLTKPIDINLLKSNLQKAAETLPQNSEPALTLKQSGTVVNVPFREIDYIESNRHIIEAHTNAGEVIVSYERLDNIVPSLPHGFYQCHKSYIVNMGQIRRFETNNTIILKNNKIIPVSRSKYNETKKAYLNYIGQSF